MIFRKLSDFYINIINLDKEEVRAEEEVLNMQTKKRKY